LHIIGIYILHKQTAKFSSEKTGYTVVVKCFSVDAAILNLLHGKFTKRTDFREKW